MVKRRKEPTAPVLEPVICPRCHETCAVRVTDVSRTKAGTFRKLTCDVCGKVFYSAEGRIALPAGKLRRRFPPDFARDRKRHESVGNRQRAT